MRPRRAHSGDDAAKTQDIPLEKGKSVPARRCQHGKFKAFCKLCGGSGICEHGKQKRTCKDCGGGQLCIHKRNKRYCKQCGGTHLCVHNKNRDFCIDCGGRHICEHKKYRRNCKVCKGKGICKHNKHKVGCKECRGSQICSHGKIKSRCPDCGGSQLCKHNKVKSRCKECGGSSICPCGKRKDSCKKCVIARGGARFCEHKKDRRYCLACDGSAYCAHNCVKWQCKQCGGSAICEHDRRRANCHECRGTQTCKHGRQKHYCRECGGRGICEHNKHRYACKECKGSRICEHSRQKGRCKCKSSRDHERTADEGEKKPPVGSEVRAVRRTTRTGMRDRRLRGKCAGAEDEDPDYQVCQTTTASKPFPDIMTGRAKRKRATPAAQGIVRETRKRPRTLSGPSATRIAEHGRGHDNDREPVDSEHVKRPRAGEETASERVQRLFDLDRRRAVSDEEVGRLWSEWNVKNGRRARSQTRLKSARPKMLAKLVGLHEQWQRQSCVESRQTLYAYLEQTRRYLESPSTLPLPEDHVGEDAEIEWLGVAEAGGRHLEGGVV